MKMRLLVCLASVLVAAAGCSGGVSPVQDSGMDTGDAALPDGLEDSLSNDIFETASGDITDGFTRDQGPREDIEPGAFGAPCNSNRDCLSNTCVEGPDGFVCSQYCVTECPDGWLCRTTTMGTDIVSVCIPEGVNLCKPCRLDSQCGDGVCLDLGEGKFCSRSCESVDCPSGFDCQDMEVGEQGVRMKQCVPSNGTCSCRVVNADEERPCIRQNEFGTCLGFERCEPDNGWVGCSAGEPALEICNGIDDDCNGVADDSLAPPEEICTNEIPDVGSCPGDWVCNGESGWGCVGPLPTAEECNYRDDNCNGLTDEDFKDDQGRYSSMQHCGVCNNACEGRIPFARVVICNASEEVPSCEVQECEPGYVKSGPQACVPRVTNLCVPCVEDDNCGFEGDKCLPLGTGLYCARDCSEGAPLGTTCPSGFLCEPQDEGIHQCVPISGTCECTHANQGMQRVCEQRNEFGTCSGVETCDAALGWVGCNARAPAAEVCDGIDNDCNGLVDDDPEPPVEACENNWTDPLDGTVYTCTAPWRCQQATGGKAWVCEAQQPSAEECNYLDDNCDGRIDEDFKVPGTAKYGDLNHCGACGVSCVGLVPNAVMFCNGSLERPQCEVESCATGYWKSSALSCSPLPDTLCRECSSDAGCQVPGDVCLPWDGLGNRYCLWDCSPDSLHPEGPGGSRCPDGFLCREFDGEGQPFFRCVPDSGSCDCLAKDSGRERLCSSENAFGRCLGSEVCDPASGWSPCDARVPAAEVCNGIDDNCNGLVDELFPAKGSACAAGLGLCRREGTLVCNDEGTGLRCSAEPGEPRDEMCNGLDDNCNRLIDEDWPDKGKVCMLGQGECLAFGMLVCSDDGLGLECDAIPAEPGEELCNGRDDNCNGLIDEDFPDLGRFCTVGVGECRRNGTFVCSADGLGVQCNAVPGPTAPELCNGLDDNCDGQIDEDFPNVGRICTVGQGECLRVGVVQCTPDGLGEMCNAVAGTPTVERCNGLDDDCNGVIDDGFPDKGKVCFDGIGECRAAGVFACSWDGLSLECDAVAGTPTAELCNGRDDNCNGQIDEAFPNVGQFCSSGAGECRRNGVFVCTGDGLGTECNAVAGSPTAEMCNGLDDDCNGLIDDTFPDKGKVCFSGVGECRSAGVYVCSGNGLSLECDAVAGTPTAEMCNGRDDDCNGLVDDAFPDLGKVCSVGVGECRRTGVFVCTPDGLGSQCNAVAGAPTVERCNGLDDDCNGVIDDGFPDKGKVCFDGIGECRAAGVYVCSGDGMSLECDAVTGTPTAELCNGLDDNCNGQIDELWPDKGKVCSSGQGECRREGVLGCSADGLVLECSAEAGPPSPEMCNGLDDDCNGQTDELWPLKGTVCTVGLGQCVASGVFECNQAGTGILCNATQGAPQAEICDYLDNDCDGVTDNGFLVGGKYSLDTHCGNCFTDCTEIYDRPNAFGVCDSSGVPICRMHCQANYFDLNLVPDDGCEFFLDPDAIYLSQADAQADDLPGCGLGPVGTGTNHRPCRTIAAGLAEAVVTLRGKVLVADGLYEETVTLVNGKSLLGGYRADTWERNLGGTLTVIRGNTTSGLHKKSVIASGLNLSTLFEGFVVYGEVNFTPGGNSYALWASNCTSAFTVRYNTFIGGAGGNGTAGGSGAHAVGGTDGNLGQDMITTETASLTTCQSLSSTPGNQGAAGNGGTRTCGASAVNGGAGAGAQCPSGTTQQPSGVNGGTSAGGGTAGAGGVGGRDRYSSNCSTFSTGGYTATGMPGTDGGQGAHGSAGSGCNVDGSTGSISAGEWVGSAGGNALNGVPGGGGGGGGAGGGADITGTCHEDGIRDSLGGSGGGGGAGGCGGESGIGGGAGGGAFTIFITATSPTTNYPVLSSNSIQPGSGGRGGDGGLGGAGGLGGNGGNGGNVDSPYGYAMGQGGRGGQGGNGGAGGGGGGGCGGVSYGVYVHNSSVTPPYAAQNTFRPGGTGGAGGAGGPSLGNSGTPGAVGDSADFLF